MVEALVAADRTRRIDPGKYRGMQQVTSEAGFFEVCAVDHLADFAKLLDPDPTAVPMAEIVQAKSELIAALAPHASAVLLDAQYGLQSVAAGVVPRETGIILAVEEETYAAPSSPRVSSMRSGWDAQKIVRAGAGMAKLLWFYRPDLDQDVAQRQRELLVRVQAECDAVSLPLVVEPIWYPVAGEDARDAQWQHDRVEGIIAAAGEASQYGADLLKVEFPGAVDSPEQIDRAIDACQRVDAAISVPWVLLSAGVGFDDFALQLEIAAQAGASGYMAGRSVWRDAVSRDAHARESGIAPAVAKLDRLREITRAHARPFHPAVSVAQASQAMPEGWYETW
ncbi:tagatose 1,6-diphosphate aldolase [Microbacterium sp. A204]|uniref:tagatose 1,6-diphosphate aldolase n=1 Tax=Microbacterium sp. A204 TaxID=3457321 RepID=UPI003FD17C73